MDEERFRHVLQNYLFPLNIGKTAQDLLQEFIDIDVNGDDLVRILDNNPVYRHLLDEMLAQKPAGAASTDEKAELMPVRRLLSLLGLVGTRNLILSLRLLRGVNGGFRNGKGQLDANPKNLLKIALMMDDRYEKLNIGYSDTAFTAAYLFDWLLALLREKKAGSKVEEYAHATLRYSLRTAFLSYRLAEKVNGFGYGKYALAAGLCTGLGKIVMANEFQKPGKSWFTLQAELERDPLSPTAELLAEKGRFQTHHAELSALCLRFSAILRPLENSVYHYQEPYMLKKSTKNEYQLAVVLYTASRMAADWRLPINEKDAMIQGWKSPWLQSLKISDEQLIDAIQWAMKIP